MTKELNATCAMCGETQSVNVSPADWMRYTNGALVQSVWPDESVDFKEIVIANRPGNIFGALGYWCVPCNESNL